MLEINIVPESDPDRRAAICREILAALPDWFGISEATAAYIAEVRNLAMLVASDGSGTPLAFATLKETTPVAAELHLMAVRPQYRGRGIGRALLAAIETMARRRGIATLTVKTLAPSVEDANYAATRAFYLAAGFRALAVFPDLWGPDNPCLVMAKPLV
jgi:GNAT superfamily N-acetyltransferase